MKKHIFIFFILLPLTFYAQTIVPIEVKMIDGIRNTEIYLSKPIVTSNGDFMMFVSSYRNEKGFYNHQIQLAQNKGKNQWEIIDVSIPFNQNFNNVPIGSGKTENCFYVFSTPKHGKKGNAIINVLSQNNKEWVIKKNIEIPEFFPEKKGFDLFMSSNENVLLFSFFEGNSVGKEDIYAMVKESDGNWSSLINLGKTINSKASEITPFYDEDSKLLFFSTNNNSNGKYSIFYSKRLDNSWVNWSPIQSIGAEINSDMNESGFYFSNQVGYFVSDKNALFNDFYTINGLNMFKTDAQKAIENAGLFEKNNMSDECENKINLLEQQIVLLTAKNDSIQKSSQNKVQFITTNSSNPSVFEAISILFNLNSYELSEESQSLLTNIANYLLVNTDLGLKISGFCDTKGSVKYNIKLSEQRALAVKNNLINKGIDKSRLQIIGMGKATPNTEQISEKDMAYYRRVDLVFESLKK